jgi:hypothetical protein
MPANWDPCPGKRKAVFTKPLSFRGGTKRAIQRTIKQDAMTDQEKQLIEGLASRIHNAPPPEIDKDADAAIRNGIGNRPDALYIFTQTVLVQEMALNQAKAQIEELTKKLQERSSQSSFLGTPAPSQSAPAHPGQPSWWGGHSAAQPPAGPPPLPPQQSAQPYYQQSAPPPPPPPASGGMFSGFLRNAATTAAGVVAGEVAFSALSGIFGHHSGGGFMGGGSGFFGGASGISPGSETIINNYYDSPAGQSGASEHSGTGSQFVDPDTDDTDNASANAATDNGGPDDVETDDSYDDDTSSDDSTDDSYDDSSSYDDSGSYDDGGSSDDI